MTRYLQGIGYFVCSLVLISGVLSAKASEAATYYVATTGSDSNSCTQTQNKSTPKRTINAALNCIGTAAGAGAGHTVQVANGTYAEVINNNMPGGTSWNAPFTLKAENKHGVLIKPSSGSRIINLQRSSTKFVIIDGFVMDATNVDIGAVRIFTSSSSGTASRIRIQNCEIKNVALGLNTTVANGSGISDDNLTCCNEFINNKLHDIGSNKFDHALYIKSKNNLIERNLVYNISGHGIQVSYSKEKTADDNIVRFNISHTSGTSADTGSGIIINNGKRNQVYNNILYNNNGGIYVRQADDTLVYNNTIYANNLDGNTKKVCARIQDTSNTKFKNNICYQNKDGLFDLRGSNSGLDSTQNLETNPSFVDAAKANFKLQKDSSAINNGLTIFLVSSDFDGVLRPQGAGYDIGAYEYVGSLLNPPSNLRITSK